MENNYQSLLAEKKHLKDQVADMSTNLEKMQVIYRSKELASSLLYEIRGQFITGGYDLNKVLFILKC
jgi:predicted LPLAT superfamily acyltransferase